MQYEKSVGVVVYRENQSEVEFLLLEAPRLAAKPEDTKNKTYWSFPKGHQEKGETDHQTAFREIKEETGITLVELDRGFKEIEKYFYRRDGELRSKTIVYYLSKVSYNIAVTISDEHINYEWAEKDKALELLKIKPAKAMLLKASEHILNGKSQLSML